MTSSWDEYFPRAIELARREGRFRQPRGRSVRTVDLGSNDYLGLSTHADVILAAEQATRHESEKVSTDARWGSGASPVIGGSSEYHQQLHASLASLAGSPAALSFTSGYATNVGVLSAVADKYDAILSDQLNHASLIDGARLSGSKRIIYPHRDATFVEDWLRSHRSSVRHALIVTESVFSMDGDKAPIVDLFRLANKYDCCLVVDEAHATGIYGDRGGGCIEEAGFASTWPERLIKLGTLSKALGGIGGFVCGTQNCIDYLVNYCRSYLFSTAAPQSCVAAANAAAQLVPSLGHQRKLLLEMSRSLRERLHEQGWQTTLEKEPKHVDTGDSPIIPIVIGESSETVQIADSLLAAGFSVPAIRPPTVPLGTSRLRISLSTRVSDGDIQGFLTALGHPSH